MTDFDLLLLKAEIFALKLLIPPPLGLLADQFDDRERFLSEIELNAIGAIKSAAQSFTKSQTDQAAFVQVAAGVISVAVQSARDSNIAPSPQPH